MQFLTRLLVTAAAAALAVFLVPGLNLTATETQDQLITLLSVALLIGAVNTLVRPIARFFGTCFILLTFGLFLLVINAGMLLLVGWIAQQINIGFTVDGFWPAFWGALVISVVGALLGGVLGDGRRRED